MNQTTAPSNPNDWVMKQGPESSTAQPTHYKLRLSYVTATMDKAQLKFEPD